MKDILSYEEFKGEFVSELYAHIPDGAKLIVNTDGVNESVVYDDGSDNIIKPSYKLKTAYKMYKNGRDLEKMALSIADELYRATFSADCNTSEELYNKLLSKEYMLENIVIQIADKNYKEQTGKAPHINIPGTDLCAIFRVIVERREDQTLSFIVTEKLMKGAGLTIKDMYMSAMKNLLKDGFVMGVFDKLTNVPQNIDMRGISTNSGMYGASVIMFPDILEQIADDMGGDYFIFPLNVHELILVPADTDDEKERYIISMALKSMLMETNKTVDENDILSEEIFFYDKEEKKLCQAA